MRRYLLMIACCAAMLPTTMCAQKHIEKAIDELAATTGIVTNEVHTSQKDPRTGKIESQKDTYDIRLDASQTQWIDKLRAAFRQDRPDAYQEKTVVGNSSHNPLPLFIENDVTFMTRNYNNYIVMNFTVPGDTAMALRHIYALAWKKNESDNTITGTLLVLLGKNPASAKKTSLPVIDMSSAEILPSAVGSFAPTIPQGYNVMDSKERFAKTLQNLDIGLDDKAWMERFESYVHTIRVLNTIEHPFYPAKIFLLSCNIDKVSKASRQKAIQSLKELQNKTNNSDYKQIYEKAINNLSK